MSQDQTTQQDGLSETEPRQRFGAASCSALWKHEYPPEDGVYLKKFDRYDDDDEAETYHVRNGKTYSLDGKEWFSFGGVWKRIGDLPNK